jgi:hypothetical protein
MSQEMFMTLAGAAAAAAAAVTAKEVVVDT